MYLQVTSSNIHCSILWQLVAGVHTLSLFGFLIKPVKYWLTITEFVTLSARLHLFLLWNKTIKQHFKPLFATFTSWTSKKMKSRFQPDYRQQGPLLRQSSHTSPNLSIPLERALAQETIPCGEGQRMRVLGLCAFQTEHLKSVPWGNKSSQPNAWPLRAFSVDFFPPFSKLFFGCSPTSTKNWEKSFFFGRCPRENWEKWSTRCAALKDGGLWGSWEFEFHFLME